jgi:protein-tyrosine phosphatase
MVLASDLILVMERGHQQQIYSLAPAARGRVQMLGKWLDREIPDPYKKSPEYFEHVLGLIEQDVKAWSKKLWG